MIVVMVSLLLLMRSGGEFLVGLAEILFGVGWSGGKSAVYIN